MTKFNNAEAQHWIDFFLNEDKPFNDTILNAMDFMTNASPAMFCEEEDCIIVPDHVQEETRARAQFPASERLQFQTLRALRSGHLSVNDQIRLDLFLAHTAGRSQCIVS